MASSALSPLTHAAIASLATYALIKGPTNGNQKTTAEAFAAFDCKGDEPIFKKVKNECKKEEMGDSERDFAKFCKKTNTDEGKKFCTDNKIDTNTRPETSGNTPASNTKFAIKVKIDDKIVKFDGITDKTTVKELLTFIEKDKDLSSKTGFIGLGRFGFINFEMIVDDDKKEGVLDDFELDDALLKLGDELIENNSTVEIVVKNTIPYAVSAISSLCCCALIGLLVYFMFMQGGYY